MNYGYPMDGCRCKSCVEARDQGAPEDAPVFDEFEDATESVDEPEDAPVEPEDAPVEPEDAPAFDEFEYAPESVDEPEDKTKDQDKPENAPFNQLSIESVQVIESVGKKKSSKKKPEKKTVVSGSKSLQKSKTDKQKRKREEKKLSCSKKRRADGQDENLFFCPSIECKFLKPFEHLGKLSKHVQDNHLLTKVSCKAG